MGLLAEHRTLAAAVVADESRFAEAFTLTAPGGSPQSLTGQIGDISAVINPDTGLPITGRQLSAVVSEAALLAAGFDLDSNLDDAHTAVIAGYNWRAADRRRDRTLKLVTLFFEPWRV